MTKKEKKKVTVYMPVAEHERFKKACAKVDTNMAAKFLELSKNFSDKSEKAT